MKLIIKYLRKQKLLFLLNFIAILSFVIVELGIPTVTGIMIDEGIVTNNMNLLSQMAWVLFALAIFGGLGSVLSGYTSSRMATRMTLQIRKDLFEKSQELSHSEYNELGVSSMITRVTNDVYQLQLFTQMLLRMGLITPIMIASSFFLIFKSNLKLALINLLSVPFILLTVYLIGKKSNVFSKIQQSNLDTLNRITRENITGVRVIRAFRQDDHESKRFGKINQTYADVSKRLFRLVSKTEPLFFFILHMIVLVVFWVASDMIDLGQLQVGSLVAFLEYQFHGLFSLMLFSYVFIMYPRAAVSASRIEEFLYKEALIQNPKDGISTIDEETYLEFKNVSFNYPDSKANVLSDISFSAKANQTVAFIGSTGSGKSTLINLMVRFYDVTQGEIRLNGVDIREYDLYALRDHFGFIPQKANLFSGSISDNIRYGKKDALMNEIVESAQVASAKEFIESRPQQYEEWLSEGGSNLSGGQKQRMSIARAIVRKPEIYVFDDSFSALDYKTDATIRQNLKEQTKDAIVFVVAQRISSIIEADQIIVLDEGKMVGIGTHKELMKTNAVYQEIAASQFSEKEMALYE